MKTFCEKGREKSQGGRGAKCIIKYPPDDISNNPACNSLWLTWEMRESTTVGLFTEIDAWAFISFADLATD